MTIFPATPILGLRLTFPPWQQPSPSHLLSLSPSPISGELFCQLSAAASTHVKGRLEDRGMGGGGRCLGEDVGQLGILKLGGSVACCPCATVGTYPEDERCLLH